MTTTDPDFEPIETQVRCGDCGERPVIRKYKDAESYRMTCACGGFAGVSYTSLEWLTAEFCNPYVSTGRPAPTRKPPEASA
jgi:hypothetical protein